MDVVLEPGERALVPTGVGVALPHGTVGLVHPRSGLAARAGLSIVNTPGTIDAGYRGEIKVCLINLDPRTAITVTRGDRIAQLLVQRVELPEFVEVATLDETSRGAGGYGSSGGHALLTPDDVDEAGLAADVEVGVADGRGRHAGPGAEPERTIGHDHR